MRRLTKRAVGRAAVGMLLGGLALATSVTRPAAAEDWQQWYGLNCGGIQVDRCAWLDYDRGTNRVRANGNTRDEPNGGNYSVAVNDTMVQLLPFGQGWTTVQSTVTGDFDGWHPVWDSSRTTSAGVWCGVQYRALTYHRWTGDSSGGEWIASTPMTFC